MYFLPFLVERSLVTTMDLFCVRSTQLAFWRHSLWLVSRWQATQRTVRMLRTFHKRCISGPLPMGQLLEPMHWCLSNIPSMCPETQTKYLLAYADNYSIIATFVSKFVLPNARNLLSPHWKVCPGECIKNQFCRIIGSTCLCPSCKAILWLLPAIPTQIDQYQVKYKYNIKSKQYKVECNTQ